jgi:hypothetical protein
MLLIAPIIWFWLWNTFFTLALLVSAEPSEVSFVNGEGQNLGKAEGEPENQSIKRTNYVGYPALKLKVTKGPGAKLVHINQVRVIHKPLEEKVLVVFGIHPPQNVIQPNCFFVEMSSRPGTQTARMQEKGTPSEGPVVLSEEFSTAILHIDFKPVAECCGPEPIGACFQYVLVEIDVSNESGSQHDVLRMKEPILIFPQKPRPLGKDIDKEAKR